ncbi:MAG: amino acid transporter permease [Proteobacteria bacterium]|nr:amino acid transporter permease [Pseudomonadota bacterium]
MNPELITDNLSYFLFGAWPNGGAMGGLLLTLWMSFVACILASILGLAGGIALTMGSPGLRAALESAIAVLRGIPVIMLIFWCYFLLPVLFGLNVPGVATVIAALALINAAYLSQAVRAGLAAIGPGQWHAGLALGLTRWKTLRLVILPQGLRIMLPSFINQWVTLIKDTSLAFIVGVPELTMVSGQVNNREQVYPLQIYLFTAILYFLLCAGLSTFARQSERWWNPRHKGARHA